jgi:hypothetical protein
LDGNPCSRLGDSVASMPERRNDEQARFFGTAQDIVDDLSGSIKGTHVGHNQDARAPGERVHPVFCFTGAEPVLELQRRMS